MHWGAVYHMAQAKKIVNKKPQKINNVSVTFAILFRASNQAQTGLSFCLPLTVISKLRLNIEYALIIEHVITRYRSKHDFHFWSKGYIL